MFKKNGLQISWTHLITPCRNFLEVRWRSLFQSTSLGKRCTSYNAPPTSRKRAADRWLLRNFLPWSSLFMVGKAQKSHEVRYYNGVPPIHFFQDEHRIQFRPCPMQFLRFSNHEKGAPGQEISNWLTVCSTFSRSGWSVVRSASLAKGGTPKNTPSLHLHKVPTRSNKVSPRTSQTALVFSLWLFCVIMNYFENWTTRYLNSLLSCISWVRDNRPNVAHRRQWQFRTRCFKMNAMIAVCMSQLIGAVTIMQ
jgi:hypothetical protein